MKRLEKLLYGLMVLSKYDSSDVTAEHDIIYAGPHSEKVSEGDAKQLKELGWHLDSEASGWAFFT